MKNTRRSQFGPLCHAKSESGVTLARRVFFYWFWYPRGRRVV